MGGGLVFGKLFEFTVYIICDSPQSLWSHPKSISLAYLIIDVADAVRVAIAPEEHVDHLVKFPFPFQHAHRNQRHRTSSLGRRLQLEKQREDPIRIGMEASCVVDLRVRGRLEALGMDSIPVHMSWSSAYLAR